MTQYVVALIQPESSTKSNTRSVLIGTWKTFLHTLSSPLLTCSAIDFTMVKSITQHIINFTPAVKHFSHFSQKTQVGEFNVTTEFTSAVTIIELN